MKCDLQFVTVFIPMIGFDTMNVKSYAEDQNDQKRAESNSNINGRNQIDTQSNWNKYVQ